MTDPFPRWDETAIVPDETTLGDLEAFFGIDAKACQSRLDQYRMSEMADHWRSASPVAPHEIRAFYSLTPLYIWELTKWHASESYQPYLDAVRSATRLFPVETHPRVLDFGAGIATASLELAKRGYEVTISDVPGKTLDFARMRFDRRGLPVTVLEVTSDGMVPGGRGAFDFLVSFDVLEHVPDAEGILWKLAAAVRPGGAALIVADFADFGDHPQHLDENRCRFAALRWDWLMAAAGLRAVAPPVFVKASSFWSVPRQVRWRLHRHLGVGRRGTEPDRPR